MIYATQVLFVVALGIMLAMVYRYFILKCGTPDMANGILAITVACCYAFFALYYYLHFTNRYLFPGNLLIAYLFVVIGFNQISGSREASKNNKN